MPPARTKSNTSATIPRSRNKPPARAKSCDSSTISKNKPPVRAKSTDGTISRTKSKRKTGSSITKRKVRFTEKEPLIIPDTPTTQRLPACEFYTQQELFLFRRDVLVAVSQRQKGVLKASAYEWRGLEDHLSEGGMPATEKKTLAYIREVVDRHIELKSKTTDGEVTNDSPASNSKKDEEALRRLAAAKSAFGRKEAARRALEDAKAAKEIYDKTGIDTQPYKSLASIPSSSSPKQQKKTKTRSVDQQKKDRLNEKTDKLVRKDSMMQSLVKGVKITWKRKA